MKKLITTLVLGMISSTSFAAGQSSQVRYCDDITRVDNFSHLDEGQFKRYLESKGEVDRILVSKDRRQLYLLNDDVVLKTYTVAFGAGSIGVAKHFEGDGETPEGLYSIDYKNPKSAYYLSLHVSYPNADDIAYAKARNKSPGGDIMVHGFPVKSPDHAFAAWTHPKDWTQGCIAVTDEQINEIFSLVKEGTTIEICKRTAKK